MNRNSNGIKQERVKEPNNQQARRLMTKIQQEQNQRISKTENLVTEIQEENATK